MHAVEPAIAVLRRWVAASLGISNPEPLPVIGPDAEQAAVELAEQQRVAGLLGRPSARAKLNFLDETTRERFQRAHRATVATNLKFLQMFRSAGHALASAKIPFAPLKGMWLILRLYQDLGARSMVDLDLLVPIGKFWRAYDAIAGGGFVPTDTVPGARLPFRAFYDHHFTHPDLPGSLLEIHRYFVYRAFALFDYKQVLGRASLAREDDVEYRALTAEDTLLHLAVHSAKHGYRITLRDTADVAAIVKLHAASLRWRRIVDDARTAGAATSVWIALESARAALGAQIPADVLRELAPSEQRREAIAATIDMENGTGVRSDDDIERARRLVFDTAWRAAWWRCSQGIIMTGDRVRTQLSRMLGG